MDIEFRKLAKDIAVSCTQEELVELYLTEMETAILIEEQNNKLRNKIKLLKKKLYSKRGK